MRKTCQLVKKEMQSIQRNNARNNTVTKTHFVIDGNIHQKQKNMHICMRPKLPQTSTMLSNSPQT